MTRIGEGKTSGWVRALDALYGRGPSATEVHTALAKLRARLRRLEAEVYFDVLGRSPLGPVYLAAGKRGLVAIGLATDERSFARRVTRAMGTAPVRSQVRLREARRQMREYLSGRRRTFDLRVDLRRATPFQRSVLEVAQRIPRGSILTYRDIALRLRRPHASRAVGQALAHNPLPVLIPCHRVVSPTGELRGYLGDRIGLKARLLALEGIPLQGNRCQVLRLKGTGR